MRSYRKNLILGGSGKIHIFCRLGFGIPGLLRNAYVDLIVNSPVGVRFHFRHPCSSLAVVAVKIGFSFIISSIKKDIMVSWCCGWVYW
jgi:hypothetical protein